MVYVGDCPSVSQAMRYGFFCSKAFFFKGECLIYSPLIVPGNNMKSVDNSVFRWGGLLSHYRLGDIL